MDERLELEDIVVLSTDEVTEDDERGLRHQVNALSLKSGGLYADCFKYVRKNRVYRKLTKTFAALSQIVAIGSLAGTSFMMAVDSDYKLSDHIGYYFGIVSVPLIASLVCYRKFGAYAERVKETANEYNMLIQKKDELKRKIKNIQEAKERKLNEAKRKFEEVERDLMERGDGFYIPNNGEIH